VTLLNIGTMQFRSRVLERRATFSFSLPLARHAGPGPYPALLLLHGWGGDHATLLHTTTIAQQLEGQPLIAIVPDGGNHHWANQGPQARIEDFLLDDLLPACAEFFPIRPGRWAIGGVSMGGYGAVRLGLKYPDRFGSISAHAGRYLDRAALDELAPTLTPDERADADVFAWAERAATHTARPTLRFDCGTDDPLLPQNRAFHQYLETIGYAHTYAEHPGAHTADYFDARLRDDPRDHIGALAGEVAPRRQSSR
jgi:S-formylglutathione hydrolase FrmB